MRSRPSRPLSSPWHLVVACVATLGCPLDHPLVAPDATTPLDVTSDLSQPDATVDATSDAAGDTVDVPPTDQPTPDVTDPDVATPDVTTPDVTDPDVTAPDVTAPDVTAPDVTAPDVTAPDVTVPDVSAPDVTAPDVTVPDVTVPDVTVPDVAVPDVSRPDVPVPDVAPPDVLVCTPPRTRCGDACVDTTTSTAHCGACGLTCTNRCVASVCVDVIAVSAGDLHTCAVLRGGTLRCWGTNAEMRVGDGTTTNRLRPVRVETLGTVTSLGLGKDHGCVSLMDGAVRCWGDNAGRELGDNSTTDRGTPTLVMGLGGFATQVSAGDNFTCARLANSTVRCWGEHDRGQLGYGMMAVPTTPVTVAGLTTATQVSCGGEFACAVAGGAVHCWGRNDHVQLGRATPGESTSPLLVAGLTDVVQVAAGSDHVCARLASGAVRCWGENNVGQLGTGSMMPAESATPVAVSGLSGETAVDLACGGNQCCVALASGAVRCWGENGGGQLGDNSTTSPRNMPVAVRNLTDAVQVTTRGPGHSCARRRDGSLFCWGLNGGGQLGDDSTSQRLSPVAVAW